MKKSLRDRWEAIVNHPAWDGVTDIKWLAANYDIEDTEDDMRQWNLEEADDFYSEV